MAASAGALEYIGSRTAELHGHLNSHGMYIGNTTYPVGAEQSLHISSVKFYQVQV
jgi:hypothetical protein